GREDGLGPQGWDLWGAARLRLLTFRRLRLVSVCFG
ncbi:protein phosphatase 1, regulatory (inhibitor) subunit 1B, isoform CRA_b, partial [Mus musculus]